MLPDRREEWALHALGYTPVAGIDEAGRGAWAGPVTAAAVILPPHTPELAERLAGVRDSKLLTPRRRDALFDVVRETALAWAVGWSGPEVIDGTSIIVATRLAMLEAVRGLALRPGALLIDAVPLPAAGLPYRALVRADVTCLCVAAASILAKVSRDRLMVELAARHPEYGFERHKGYGTAVHQAALARWGPTAIHRHSFAPIRTLSRTI